MSREKEVRALWLFVGIVLGLSVLHWIVFFLADRAGLRLNRFVFGVIRSYGPTLAALTALSWSGGRPALRRLWSRIVRWQVPGRLYALVFLGAASTLLVIVGSIRWWGSPSLVPAAVNPLKLIAIFVMMILLDGPLGEEPGWRGFFLPQLMRRHSPFVATALVAAVWFLWHLPLYHADGTDLTRIYLAKYLLFTLALSFLHTWFFTRSGGSVFLSVVFHNSTNYIVLLGFTIFPSFRAETLPGQIYFVCAMVLGGLAALSVWRNGRVATSAPTPP